MRKVIDLQLKIGQRDIQDIEIDLDCRDEIPQVLLGLQHIYSDKKLRKRVFAILSTIVPTNVDAKNGRPGMDLWKILVLGTLRLDCNWNYDKLHDIANNHFTIREFLGHSLYDFDQRYSLQTLKDNIRLFTPKILEQINVVVVEAGHQFLNNVDDLKLKGRCDSFVVETDVHFPTDTNLLLDAIRKIIFLIGGLCFRLGITEWRQYEHLFKNVRKAFNAARKLKRSTSKNETVCQKREDLIKDAHRQYVDLVESLVARAKLTLSILDGMDVGETAHILVIEKFISDAERQIEQIRRRILNGETIPHHEKVFSIFEEHTEWICKGKAGVPQELGLGVCVLEDQFGFVLHHHVMEGQKDVDIAVDMVLKAKGKFPGLSACSFDRGFYSPQNKIDLMELLELAAMPKKGKLSKKDKEFEYSEEFIEARKKHPAVESAINALENHGLDKCPDHGIFGFKRYVGLAVVARNLQVLGAAIRKKELKRKKRLAKKQAA